MPCEKVKLDSSGGGFDRLTRVLPPGLTVAAQYVHAAEAVQNYRQAWTGRREVREFSRLTEPADSQLHDAGYPGRPALGSAKPDNEKITWECCRE